MGRVPWAPAPLLTTVGLWKASCVGAGTGPPSQKHTQRKGLIRLGVACVCCLRVNVCVGTLPLAPTPAWAGLGWGSRPVARWERRAVYSCCTSGVKATLGGGGLGRVAGVKSTVTRFEVGALAMEPWGWPGASPLPCQVGAPRLPCSFCSMSTGHGTVGTLPPVVPLRWGAPGPLVPGGWGGSGVLGIRASVTPVGVNQGIYTRH